MLEKLNNWVLERHIRKLLEKYYAQFSITLEEAKTMSIYQLLQKIENNLELNATKQLAEPIINKSIDKSFNNSASNTKEHTNSELSFENTIRNTLKDKHSQFGLTKDDIQKMTVVELLQKIDERLKNSDKEFSYYANVVNNLEQKVDKLVIENKEMKERIIGMKAENKGLNVELANLREENYKLKLENSLYQQRSITKENTKSLSIAK
jgi:hypothetical protein